MVDEGKREFWKYAVYTIVTSIPVAHMFYTMWIGGTWRYASTIASSVAFVPDGQTGVIAGLLFGLGIYLGLLLLFMQNRQKYYQGTLFLLGTVATLALLGVLGIGLPGFELSLINAGSLVAGMVLIALAETVDTDRSIPLTDGAELEGRLHQIDRRQSSWGHAVDARGNELEFPIATYGLISYIIGVVLFANVMNFVVAEPEIGSLQLFHAGGSLVFLWVMGSFLTLNPSSDTDLQVLGPTQSGKTYFVLATALEAKRNDRFDMAKAEGWINELIEEHKEWAKKKRQLGDRGVDLDIDQDTDDGVIDWDIDFTEVEQTYQTNFTVVVNDRIPKSLHFNVIDHAGEFLVDVADRIGNSAVTDGGSEDYKFACSECTTGYMDESLSSGDKCPECESGEIIEMDDIPDGSENGDDAEYDSRAFDVNELRSIVGELSDDGEAESSQEESSDAESASTVSGTETEDEDTTIDDDGTTGDDTMNGHVDGTTVDEGDTGDSSPEREGSTARSSPEDEPAKVSSPSDGENTSEEVSLDEIEIVDRLVEKTVESDTLVMMLDCDRLIGGEPAGPGSGSLETTQMNRIINGAEPDRVVLVATKADVLIDSWKGWHRTHQGGSLDQDRLPDPHELDQYQQSFREYVTERFEDETGALLNNADAGTVYPVYFETQRTTRETELSEESGDKKWVPEPNANGELQPHGYGEVLTVIARDSS